MNKATGLAILALSLIAILSTIDYETVKNSEKDINDVNNHPWMTE